MASKNEYKENYEIALTKENLDVIQEIIFELNSLPKEEKQIYRDLYLQIGTDLFERDIKLRNYNLAIYDAELDRKENKTKGKSTKRKKEENTNELFDDVFCDFYKRSEEIFEDLKYHFLFQLSSTINQKTTLLIITDDRFFDNPLLEKIIEKNATISPQKFTIQGFSDIVLKKPDILENQYLLLLAISPTAGTNSEFGILKNLLLKFESCSIINPHKACNLSVGDYSYKKIDAVEIDKIEKITTNLLNNKAVSHEEEKVIKLLLSKNTAITDYKILKSGFSGSKVIEVQPVRNLPGSSSIRYVIKFSRKTEERKIYYEKESFKRYLLELKVDGYSFDYGETDQCEAILYNYASADSRQDSHSFAMLLNDYLSSNRKLSHDLNKTLEELFNCKPFQKWTGLTLIKKMVGTLYEQYLNEDKVLATISKIENISREDVQRSDIFKDYKKILSYELIANEKICHGDLHTENFFKDEDDVYLIDFGYTQENHSLIDHSTLEASIKFKHIPFYTPIDELIEIEKKLLGINSFDEKIDLAFISRPYLKDVFKLVVKIRYEALKNLRNSVDPIEYFISLFIITFRQIQYPDLNQKYALELAKVLGRFIATKI